MFIVLDSKETHDLFVMSGLILDGGTGTTMSSDLGDLFYEVDGETQRGQFCLILK